MPISNLSGPEWWHANEGKYPNSSDVADLSDRFRPKVEAFLAALDDAGATVEISTTRRNRDRAYLMRYSWDIAKGLIRASAAPPRKGVTIEWDHGHREQSRVAAQQMADLFDIAYRPSLGSLHISGHAIDMTISWSATLDIKNKSGKTISIGAPNSGENRKLHAVGKSYGVIKLLSDAPHWSVDGH